MWQAKGFCDFYKWTPPQLNMKQSWEILNLTWPCVLIDIASQSGLNMLQANLSQFLSSYSLSTIFWLAMWCDRKSIWDDLDVCCRNITFLLILHCHLLCIYMHFWSHRITGNDNVNQSLLSVCTCQCLLLVCLFMYLLLVHRSMESNNCIILLFETLACPVDMVLLDLFIIFLKRKPQTWNKALWSKKDPSRTRKIPWNNRLQRKEKAMRRMRIQT